MTASARSGDEPALDDADLSASVGMIFALLGPYGAGSAWRRPLSEPPATSGGR